MVCIATTVTFQFSRLGIEIPLTSCAKPMNTDHDYERIGDPVCGVLLFDSACAGILNINDQNRSMMGLNLSNHVTSNISNEPSGVLVGASRHLGTGATCIKLLSVCENGTYASTWITAGIGRPFKKTSKQP